MVSKFIIKWRAENVDWNLKNQVLCGLQDPKNILQIKNLSEVKWIEGAEQYMHCIND